MAWGSKKGGSGGPAWLALIVALAALWIAWSAYRRTGGTLDTLLALSAPEWPARTVEADRGDWRDALERALERLLEQRDDVGQDRNREQVQREVAEIRATLERAYRNAGEGASDTWRDLDAQLGRLEDQVRDGSAKAKGTMEDLLAKMKDAV
ncbi:MAG TPA: hypothetical protein VJ885_08120 [Thermoanaerobaculia bacterium]|nr:hypothetical protein [Thermoanaerobaculia bacterium]